MSFGRTSKSFVFGLLTALAVSTAVAPAQAAPTVSVKTGSLGSVYFASGSAKLNSAARITLWRWLPQVNAASTLNVVGYVQKSGSASNDRTLSAARAKIVIAFFTNRGVKAKLTAKAGRVPANRGTAASARRAEVVITSVKPVVTPTPTPTPTETSSPTPTPTCSNSLPTLLDPCATESPTPTPTPTATCDPGLGLLDPCPTDSPTPTASPTAGTVKATILVQNLADNLALSDNMTCSDVQAYLTLEIFMGSSVSGNVTYGAVSESSASDCVFEVTYVDAPVGNWDALVNFDDRFANVMGAVVAGDNPHDYTLDSPTANLLWLDTYHTVPITYQGEAYTVPTITLVAPAVTPSPTPSPTSTATYSMSGTFAVNLPANTYACSGFSLNKLAVSQAGGSTFNAIITDLVDVNGDASRCEMDWIVEGLSAGAYSIEQGLICDSEVCDLFTVNNDWSQDAATYDNTLFSVADTDVSADVTGVDTELTLPTPSPTPTPTPSAAFGSVAASVTVADLNYALGMSNANACLVVTADITLTPVGGGASISIPAATPGQGGSALSGMYYNCYFTLNLSNVPVGDYTVVITLFDTSSAGQVGYLGNSTSGVTAEGNGDNVFGVWVTNPITVSDSTQTTVPNIVLYVAT